jgi:hypothetical protein
MKMKVLAARERLSKNGAAGHDEEEQHRLRSAAAACFGALASGQGHRSEKTRDAVRRRLGRRKER